MLNDNRDGSLCTNIRCMAVCRCAQNVDGAFPVCCLDGRPPYEAPKTDHTHVGGWCVGLDCKVDSLEHHFLDPLNADAFND